MYKALSAIIFSLCIAALCSCTSRCINPTMHFTWAPSDTSSLHLRHLVFVKYDRTSSFSTIKEIVSVYDTLYGSEQYVVGDTNVTGFSYIDFETIENYDWMVYIPDRNKTYKVSDIQFEQQNKKLGLSRECSSSGTCMVNDSVISIPTQYEFVAKHGRRTQFAYITIRY